MPMPRVLIAGVGNIFLGDDGFGVEVAARLAALGLPEWIAVGDYGISGMHLAYDLADGVELAILIDAMPRGGEPGTVYVAEPEPGSGPAVFDSHGMQPDVVLSMLGTLGAQVPRVLIVGCEPGCAGEGIGLSAPVGAAVDEAVKAVLGLLGETQNTGGWPDVPRDTRRGDRVPARPAGSG
ncbi:MAG TPA: hydrogenase maturation protease [Streptosporangiaceae bacterium]|nr:hydrogenase maturation protease [Streptosporangiaceae bacterium]